MGSMSAAVTDQLEITVENVPTQSAHYLGLLLHMHTVSISLTLVAVKRELHILSKKKVDGDMRINLT